jgi:hypothetical protein
LCENAFLLAEISKWEGGWHPQQIHGSGSSSSSSARKSPTRQGGLVAKGGHWRPGGCSCGYLACHILQTIRLCRGAHGGRSLPPVVALCSVELTT